MDLKATLDHHISDIVYRTFTVAGIEFPFSKHVFLMLLSAGILTLVAAFAAHGKGNVARLLRHAIEAMALYVRDELVRPNLGHHGDQYLGFFLTLFFFILTMNLVGMVPIPAFDAGGLHFPGLGTATGNFRVTTGLAVATFCMIHIVGVKEQGAVHYFHSIVPSGVPLWLWPLMFPIEVLGFVIKAFALAIRLFLNMIAGHIVITVLLSLIIIFGTEMGPAIGLGATAPVSTLMVIFISCLELFVCFLQAYIFTFLTAIFVGAAAHGH